MVNLKAFGVVVELQTRIREMIGSNIGWDTGFPGRVFLLFFRLFRKIRDSASIWE
jgi:hypothetical protein